MTKTPEINPIRAADCTETKAQGAVIATNPANIPLIIIDGSGFLVLNHHMYNIEANAPVAEAIMVLTAITLILKSPPANVDPGLNPNQPNARIKQPITAIGIGYVRE